MLKTPLVGRLAGCFVLVTTSMVMIWGRSNGGVSSRRVPVEIWRLELGGRGGRGRGRRRLSDDALHYCHELSLPYWSGIMNSIHLPLCQSIVEPETEEAGSFYLDREERGGEAGVRRTCLRRIAVDSSHRGSGHRLPITICFEERKEIGRWNN